jgi:hypothetical protein
MRPYLHLVIGFGIVISASHWASAQPGVAPAPNRHALLVGCTRYPSLPKERWLEGPGNDVVLMRKLLIERYHFLPEQIVTLAEGPGGEVNRPTRARIRREFERLAQTVRRGDQVVILLSGHGSQQPDQDPPDPDDPEPDGLDEIFLPADIGRWDRNRQFVTNAIVDDELRAWLRAIQDRGALLWVIIDACHSGTMIRGTEEMVLRQVPPEAFVPAEALEAARRRTAPAVARSRGSSDTASFEMPGRAAGLVAISGAQPDEPAVEEPLPREGAARVYYGLLTYTLNQILAEAKAPLTYRQLVQRVHAQYVAWGKVFPTPLLEGPDQDRLVLDAAKPPEPAPFVLRRVEGEWQINAGALQGLTAGTVLAVAPEAGRGRADEVVGHVCIPKEGLRVLEARVESCAFGAKPIRRDLPEGGQCRPVSIDYGDLRLGVAVDRIVGLEAAADGSQPAPLPEAERRRLGELLRGIAQAPGALIKVVDDPDRADWLIRRAAPQAGQVYLVPGSGWPLERGAGGLPPLFGPLAAEDRVLKDHLRRIARFQQLLRIAGDPGAESLLGGPDVDVPIELLRFANDADRVGQVVAWQARGIEFREGEIVGFRVRNLGREPIDVTVLFLDSGFGIKPLFPRVPGGDNRLPPARAAALPPERSALTRQFRITADTVGLEHLVVIAVKAREEESPADFSFLAQETIPRARGLKGVQGNEERTIESPLGRLFQKALFGEGGTRGASALDIDDYALRLLSWRTLPRPREAVAR